MKLLLHTCCGPCFLGVWEELGNHKEIETTLFYDNPNIHPEEEWEKRRDNLRIVAKEKSVKLIESEYRSEDYFGAIENAERDPRFRKDDMSMRCPICYRLRLENTAKYAKENGFDAISTTLFVSPYQRHDELKKIAQEVCDEYGLGFYYTDWRPYFREGQNKAREMGIYRQKYCGCKYSLAESRR